MGKAKRFNSYDSDVAQQRKLIQSYGQQRQNLSGLSSTFRTPGFAPIAVNPPTATATGTGKFLTASLAADQTANIAANDHVEFDTKDEDGGVVLQTGSGQADGIFELGSGTTFYLSAHLRPEFSSSSGALVIVWYDITNSAEIGSQALYHDSGSGNDANQPLAAAIVTPATNITVELRIISVTAMDGLANEYCTANLFEIALGGTTVGGGGGSGGVSFPITPTINDHGNVGTVTEDIDLSVSTAHVHKITLTGNPTLTFSNPPSTGIQIEFEIEFVQDATGNRTVTHPATVVETVGISTTATATTIVTYRTNDGGTNYHAIPALRGSISLNAGGFATVALDNLASVAVNANLIPDSDIDTDLGSIPLSWRDIFAERFALTSTGTTTVGAREIFGDSGGVIINTPTGTSLQFQVNGVDIGEFVASTIQGFNNLILDNLLILNDNASDPAVNGEFAKNGADVKVFSGGSVRSFSDIPTGSAATQALDNLASVAINVGLASDTDGADDLGTSLIAWDSLFINDIRFPNNGSPVTATPSIGYGTVTTDSIWMVIPTNQDFVILENSTSVEAFRVDTSAAKITIGSGSSGGITQLEFAGTGGGISAIIKSDNLPTSFSDNDNFIFNDPVEITGGLTITALSADSDFNATNLTDVNNLTSTSAGNITGFAQIDISDALRLTADPVNVNISLAASGIVINAVGTGDDITMQSDDVTNVLGGNTLNLGGGGATTELQITSDQAAFVANILLNGFQGFLEESGTPTGTANQARLYAIDNGAGKTVLRVIFGTGSAIDLAIEV